MWRCGPPFGSVYSVYGPRAKAMATPNKPVVSMHGYSTMAAAELISRASRPESINRSLNRIAEPTAAAKELLRSLGEKVEFWYSLRRHGTVNQCENWLKIMVANSTWRDDRNTEEELLRKEYLRLWTECIHFDASFVDQEMKRRQTEAGVVEVQPEATASGTNSSSVNV